MVYVYVSLYVLLCALKYIHNMKYKLRILMKLNINYDCYLHTVTKLKSINLLNLITHKQIKKRTHLHRYSFTQPYTRIHIPLLYIVKKSTSLQLNTSIMQVNQTHTHANVVLHIYDGIKFMWTLIKYFDSLTNYNYYLNNRINCKYSYIIKTNNNIMRTVVQLPM